LISFVLILSFVICVYIYIFICDIGMVQLSDSKHLVTCRKAMEDEQSRAKQVMDDGEVSVQRQIEDQRRQLQAEMLVTGSIGGTLTSVHVETEIKVPTYFGCICLSFPEMALLVNSQQIPHKYCIATHSLFYSMRSISL